MTFLKRHSLYFTQLMMRVLPVRDSPTLSPLMWSLKASTGTYFFGKQFRKNSAKINVWKRYDSKQLSNDGLTDEGKSRPQLEESPIILGLYNMEPKKKNIKCPFITIAEKTHIAWRTASDVLQYAYSCLCKVCYDAGSYACMPVVSQLHTVNSVMCEFGILPTCNSRT